MMSVLLVSIMHLSILELTFLLYIYAMHYTYRVLNKMVRLHFSIEFYDQIFCEDEGFWAHEKF